MTVPPAFLDELRARTTLSALIRRTVPFDAFGRDWRSRCPFHAEDGDSFFVEDAKVFYHCFGCSEHGDAIRWLTQKLGYTFDAAVALLASEAGLEVPDATPPAAPPSRSEEARLAAFAAAQAWFEANLAEERGKAARDFLEGFGADRAVQFKFGAGWAPDQADALRHAIEGHDEATLLATGLLVASSDGGSGDRFRGRLMLPLRRINGAVIGFAGKSIGGEGPLWLHTPSFSLFDRARDLFNLVNAEMPMRETGRLIVCHEPLDAVRLAAVGFEEVVTTFGSAATVAQLAALQAFGRNVALIFDGTDAGRKAAVETAHRADLQARAGGRLDVLILPPDTTIGGVLRQGGRLLFERLLAGKLDARDIAAVTSMSPFRGKRTT